MHVKVFVTVRCRGIADFHRPGAYFYPTAIVPAFSNA
jgi:hypothetical protein